LTSGKAFARGRRLAKRPGDVQQAGTSFPTPLADRRNGKKPLDFSGFRQYRELA
jgi:hypothetical protein